MEEIATTVAKFGYKDLIVHSTILAFCFRLVWSGLSWSGHKIRQFFAKKQHPYDIDLGAYKAEFEGEVDFFCLLVRYGTDGYLQNLASGRDQIDGWLQNRVIPIEVVQDSENGSKFALKLPVHKRLGTQFKCFAQVRDESKLDEIVNTLIGCDRVHDVSKSSSQFRNRAYFLLRDFGTCETVDGINNNVCFPN